jgi:hypothetical protein
MGRLIVAVTTVVMGSSLPARAQQVGKSHDSTTDHRGTFTSIRALANSADPALTEPDPQVDRRTANSVRDLAGTGKVEKQDAADEPKPREAQPKARHDVQKKAPAQNEKRPAAQQAKKQVQRRAPNDQALQQGVVGFQPWCGDPWMGKIGY